MIDLTISIATANNKRLILDCLRSIYETTKELGFEIYVVVNNSSDGSEEAIQESFPEVKLIINQEKLGFTHNHNTVIRKSKGKYVLVLNDDTIILDGALDKMVHFMEGHPEVGILGCKILNSDGSLQWSCGKGSSHKFEYFKSGVLKPLMPFFRDRHFEYTQEVSWVTGACLLVRSEAIRAIGGFDENIIIYWEDGDWCYRMIRAGWKVVFYPDASIIHYFGQTRKQYLARDMYIIYQSRLYFFSKHYSRSILYFVKMLTVLEILLRYMGASISAQNSRGRGSEGNELRFAYKQAIKLALAPSNLHNGVKP
jgi:hypothetical protein